MRTLGESHLQRWFSSYADSSHAGRRQAQVYGPTGGGFSTGGGGVVIGGWSLVDGGTSTGGVEITGVELVGGT